MRSGPRSSLSDGISYLSATIPKGSLIITLGLPGTGKSYLLNRLLKRRDISILRSDMIRKDLLRGLDIFDEAVASDEKKKEAVYDEMFRRAEEGIRRASDVALDATFFRQELRLKAAQIASECGRCFVVIECVCSGEKALERIRGRAFRDYESNALTESAYENVKRAFEPLDLCEIKARFPSVPILYMRINTEEEDRWKIEEERHL